MINLLVNVAASVAASAGIIILLWITVDAGLIKDCRR